MAAEKKNDDSREAALLYAEALKLGPSAEGGARVGAAVDRPGHLDQVMLSMVLGGLVETTALTPEEKSVWSRQFLAEMSEPSASEEAFFAELRKSGEAAGLDPAGNIVHAAADFEE